MEKSLRILHLEDDAGDAKLVMATLSKEGIACDISWQQNGKAFREALDGPAYDLIFSDYSLPDFDGPSALRLAKEKCPDTPFIFVSGTMGEDTAIESLRSGATDYVLKQNLKRLPLSVRRAVRESGERKERRLLEEKFLRAQKMEVVGQLAGGLAHDFNNLLTVILGHVQLLLGNGGPPEQRDSLKNIHRAAEAAGNLTRQLLTFSRKQPFQAVQLDLNQVILDMAGMLTRVIGANITLRTECAADLPFVKADLGMLEQVIMNLAVNARDAMPEGGILTIRSGFMDLGGTQIGFQAGARAGEFNTLSVIDTGTGISREVLARLFEPFFTTKGDGKGTGLGLTGAYSIVQQHEGWIEVKSEVGHGSEFRIFLPASREKAAPESPAARDADITRGAETILVVEDEPLLRKLVHIILEESGYQVLTADSGRQSLELFEHHRGGIDLVLTDMILADGMTGKELAALLKIKQPGLNIIYTSGYGIEQINMKTPLERDTFFLPKPFQRLELTKMIRECLDRKSAAPN
ncbi:MAG: response regulator [Fibrobacteria bacterium]